MQNIRGSPEGVIEAEFGCFLARHALQLLMYSLQYTDGGNICLYDYVQLEKYMNI